MAYPGQLIFILGVSGSGKNTMIREMLKSDLPLKQVISCKTRPLREGEVDGVDFCYITQQQFEKERDAGEYLEYELLHQMFRYATRKKDVLEKLEAGEHIIKEIDIQGIVSISAQHPDVWEVTKSVFLDIPDELMIERITKRSPLSDEEMKNRLHSAVHERELAGKYCTDVIDASGSIEDVAKKVYELISSYIQNSHR